MTAYREIVYVDKETMALVDRYLGAMNNGWRILVALVMS